MFERFTDQSRRAVVLAQEEARKLNHNYIGSEHLLLGLLHEGTGTGAKALASAGITLEAARGEVELIIGLGHEPLQGHIPFTPRAKKCLELSLREALQLGQDYIGTGHLLLGLIQEGDGAGIQVLGSLGADLIQLRDRVTRALENDPERQDGPEDLARVRLRPQGDSIRRLLDTIDNRLGSIERHLRITPPEPFARPPASAASEGTAASGASTEAAASGASTESEASGGAPDPAEVVRLKAEVTRLRALLARNDIDPDDPGSTSSATG